METLSALLTSPLDAVSGLVETVLPGTPSAAGATASGEHTYAHQCVMPAAPALRSSALCSPPLHWNAVVAAAVRPDPLKHTLRPLSHKHTGSSEPNPTFTEDTLRMILHNMFAGDSRCAHACIRAGDAVAFSSWECANTQPSMHSHSFTFLRTRPSNTRQAAGSDAQQVLGS